MQQVHQHWGLGYGEKEKALNILNIVFVCVFSMIALEQQGLHKFSLPSEPPKINHKHGTETAEFLTETAGILSERHGS